MQYPAQLESARAQQLAAEAQHALAESSYLRQLYSRMLAPGIDFRHLVMFRIAQSSGIGFLFVPLSVLTYQTIPRRLQGDATALFTMSRNVFGSVGVSLSTAAVATRTQVHMAYLSAHLSRANPNFQAALSQIKTAIQTLSTVAGDATQAAKYPRRRTRNSAKPATCRHCPK